LVEGTGRLGIKYLSQKLFFFEKVREKEMFLAKILYEPLQPVGFYIILCPGKYKEI